MTRLFIVVLTLILVVAKVSGAFDHSWWIVFLPLWAPLAFFVSAFLFVGFGMLVFLGVSAVGDWVLGFETRKLAAARRARAKLL